ncbi:MAG: hypothetical protein IPM64_18135 [Phycisphaerales bacterium]|nr:hypothetical protein [Phycisphaerales bacterium]
MSDVTGGLQSGEMPDEEQMVIRAWNMMGGEVNWIALPVIAEMFGVVDVECFLARLIALRDHMQRQAAAKVR